MLARARRFERQESERGRLGPREGAVDPGPAREIGVDREVTGARARVVIALLGEQEGDRALARAGETRAARARREWRPTSECRRRDEPEKSSPARPRPAGGRRLRRQRARAARPRGRPAAGRALARPSPRRRLSVSSGWARTLPSSRDRCASLRSSSSNALCEGRGGDVGRGGHGGFRVHSSGGKPAALWDNRRGMTWAKLDTAAVARALAAVAAEPGDLAEVYFERRVDAEWPPAEAHCGLRIRREEGLAVRLVRGRSLAREPRRDQRRRSRERPAPGGARPAGGDGRAGARGGAGAGDPAGDAAHLRRRARARHPEASRRLPVPPDHALASPRSAGGGTALGARERARGLLQPRRGDALGPLRSPGARPRGRGGRARGAGPGGPLPGARGAAAAGGRYPVLLAPGATAVLLHEAVGHALEADLLAGAADGTWSRARSGSPTP